MLEFGFGGEARFPSRFRALEVVSMFLDYYGLREEPFATACHPAFFYPGRVYRQTLDILTEAVLAGRGNQLLIADPGLGKTTTLRQLIQSVQDAGRACLFFHHRCDSAEILQTLLNELGIPSADQTVPAMRQKLSEIWFAEMLAGRRFILVFDDAHDLRDDVFATLQLLSRFETPNTKFLQIVLAGQPPLLQKLQRKNLAQFHDRIALVHRLEPLPPTETAAFILHRFTAAGHQGNPIFDSQALAVVAARSAGIPANINRICSRALLEAYARGLRSVSGDIAEKADRNLTPPVTSRQTPGAIPPGETTTPVAEKTKPVRPPAQLTYRPPVRSGFPGSTAWLTAAAVVLLSAAFALPHGILKAMTRIIAPRDVIAANSSPQNAFSQMVSHPAGVPSQLPILPTRSSGHDIANALQPPIPALSNQPSLTRELGLKVNRIVIDAGHGGFDTGAKGPHGLLEKDVCLDVALRLGRMIEENMPGAQVVYTRKDDSYVPLEERTAVANGADADLFISIHANSSDIHDVRGVETYYLSLATSNEAEQLAIRENALTQSSLHDLPDLVKKITNNEKIAESKLLAAEIQDTLSQRLQLVSRGERNRGVKHAPFIVLTGANMPAVLSEISFVSNANDESLLLESSQRQRIADGLYHGIAAYLDGFHAPPAVPQKLVTDNHINVLAGFDRSITDSYRNPL